MNLKLLFVVAVLCCVGVLCILFVAASASSASSSSPIDQRAMHQDQPPL